MPCFAGAGLLQLSRVRPFFSPKAYSGIAVAAGIFATPADAATIVQHATATTTVSDYGAAPVKIAYDLFSPRFGLLTSATFTVVTTYEFGATWDQSQMVAGRIYWSPNVTGSGSTASFGDGGVPLSLFGWDYNDGLSIELLPGDVGGLTHGPITKSGSGSTTTPFDLAVLTGEGTQLGDIWLGASNYSECLSWTCGPFDPHVSASFHLTVTYEFTPAPEPTTWALMLLGFGAAGHQVRRRRAMA